MNGGYEIYAVGTDGRARRLTNNDPISDRAPAWSPDGSRIAFWSARNGNRDIFVMNAADGSNVRQLTGHRESDRDPDWSPDSTRIVFTAARDGNNEIYVVNAAGGGERNLTNNPASDMEAVWSPDGKKILFVSNRDGNSEIYSMNVDGSGLTRLTFDDASDRQPDWQAGGDTDGDALLDAWETRGLDADGNGTIDLDLKKMGADPRHKDIFIEIDAMAGHAIYPNAVADVVAAFAKAPVSNPDGKPGITLHVDNGPASLMDPKTGAKWGSLSDWDQLAHDDVLGSGSGSNYDWSEFDGIKKARFKKEREKVFHYVVSAHVLANSPQTMGRTRGNPASDLALALAVICPKDVDCPGTPFEQAHALMHELGHNLGLHHGGVDDVNYKPNHLSIMSYSFLAGLDTGGIRGVLDYSRFYPAGSGMPNELYDLDERNLDEPTGLRADGRDAARFKTAFYCPPPRGRFEISMNVAVDWNCNGRMEGSVRDVDINNDKEVGKLSTANEWNRIVFDGGVVGALQAVQLPRRTQGRDIPVSEYIASSRRISGDAREPTVVVKGPRSGRAGKATRLTITARDDKALALLVVRLDKKSYSFLARAGQKAGYATATLLNAGVRTIRAGAIDATGNKSKTVTFKVVMRRR